jgi:hypothetical protein
MSDVKKVNSMSGRGEGEVIIARCRACSTARIRGVSWLLPESFVPRMYNYQCEG